MARKEIRIRGIENDDDIELTIAECVIVLDEILCSFYASVVEAGVSPGNEMRGKVQALDAFYASKNAVTALACLTRLNGPDLRKNMALLNDMLTSIIDHRGEPGRNLFELLREQFTLKTFAP